MSQPPFSVLHVCVGNICRSPMAERLLALALRKQLGDHAAHWYLSHGAGTGGWHAGESMNPPAARQISARGGDPSGFQARQLRADMIDSSDLILCATSAQVTHVLGMRPDARARTFVLGEFGRLLPRVDAAALPPGGSAADAYARGLALVTMVDTLRGRRGARPEDDLDDPWGGPDREFARVADQVESTVVPLAAVLIG